MPALHVLLRISVAVLLGASAWYGFVAGTRRWGPCTDGFDTEACLVVQSHETAHLFDLAVPEGISLLLLAGALLLLALLGQMPWRWRVAALTVGPIYALVGVDELRSVGRVVTFGPAEPSLPDLLFALAVFSAPLVMVGVGAVLLVRSAQRAGSRWLHPDLPLGLAWLAMFVGSPLIEFSLLSLVYGSYDAPPGTGLLRSAMVVVAAVLVIWHLVSRTAYRPAPQAASATSPAPSRSPAATSEA